MVISRTLAKRRIAAGQRPGWIAAWGLVFLDFLCFCAYVALIFWPLMTAIYVMQPANAVTYLIFFVVVFIPMQIVLIVSALWATKSRWQDEPEGRK